MIRNPTDPAADSILRLSPFVAMRYGDETVPDIGAVTSPPYDVMDRAMIESLLNNHPRNIVRLILPRLVADPMTGEDPYQRAAKLLERWRAERVLVTEDAPALYVYEYGDARHHVCGLVGALGLRDYSDRVVLPHEDVIDGIVDDRLAMLTAQGANLEPIMLVYDGQGETAEIFDRARARPPLIDVSAADQTFHRLWAIDDPADLRRVADHLAPRQALIADGHHRYAAYLRNRDRHHASGEQSGPWEAGLALLVDQSQCPLQVGPIHRAIADVTLAELLSTAGDVGGIELGEVVALDGSLPQPSSRRGSFVVTEGERHATFSYATEACGTMSDAQVLHDVLIPALRIGEDRVSYHHTVDQALSAAHQQGGVAVLMQPAGTAEVMSVAQAGLMMPRKSTSFGPKPRMGVVMRHLDDDAAMNLNAAPQRRGGDG
ncbi:MAG: DUF1015 domain-containing protein [Nocardioidaceae bacterium]|nr:DUF1015 domain-containing protein [Nocardioidaceae bacterium]